MVKIQVNSSGKAYYTSSGKVLLAPESGGGEFQLERIKDDSNNEIGTVFMIFEDANENKFKVVCLDAQYRNSAAKWLSQRSAVTNMPLYSNSLTAWWYDDAKETATANTQLILDYCASNGGVTSTACSHCRSKSFTIGGVTYYGQLPNMREVFDMWRHRVQLETMDTSASSQSSLNFSTARIIWSSSQYSNYLGLYLVNSGSVNTNSKSVDCFVCPVLEIPA